MPEPESAPVVESAPELEPVSDAFKVSDTSVKAPQPSANGGRIKASPLARRIARERGIDLRAAHGHRPRRPDHRRGRRARGRCDARRRPGRGAGLARSRRVRLTSIRKTIARRLTAAWEAPVFQGSRSPPT